MRFTYLWPWWAVMLGLAIMAGVTVYAYLRLKRPLDGRIRILLMSLRILAASVLLLCLLEPVLVERKDITPPMNLLILADTSQSMQLEDVDLGGQPVTRLSLVNRLLFDPSRHFLKDLVVRFDIHLYRFDKQPQQLSNPIERNAPSLSTGGQGGEPRSGTTPLKAEGGLTDIASSIRDASKEWQGQPIAGVLLITDGAHNASTFPMEKMTELQIPIYTVGVGNPHPPKDLKISKVEVSPVIYTKHDVPIRVTVSHTGYEGSKVRLSLMQVERSEIPHSGGDKVADAATITLTDQPSQIIEFTLNPQEEGIFQYILSLPALPDELTPENNEKAFLLKVVKTKLRVLYIDGRPRWEYTFLKRALERDPNIDATCTILSSRTPVQLRATLLERSGRYYPQTTDVNKVPRFPDTRQALQGYDVLIIGDLQPSTLTQEQRAAVVDFVEKGGKAVIFLGGGNSLGIDGFGKTALANLLPIVIPPTGCFIQDEDFNPGLTQQGAYHPITRLKEAQASNEALWRDLPTLSHWYGGFQLRGGSTILAEYRQNRTDRTVPIIIFQRSGLGKSLLITAEGLWNWAFGVWNSKVEDNTYARFWGQTIRWMATRADAKQLNVTTDETTYSVGDEVQITVYAYNESYQPVDNAELKIDVTPPDGKLFQVRSGKNPQLSGVYTAQFRANQKGSYQIRVSGNSGSSPLGEDSAQIFVQAPLAEFENPQLNEALLKELAAKTGGVYTPIAQAESLPDKIKEVRERVFAVQERDLWDSPIVLILAVGFLGAEWFLRKRRGLV